MAAIWGGLCTDSLWRGLCTDSLWRGYRFAMNDIKKSKNISGEAYIQSFNANARVLINHWSTIWQMPFNLTKCEYLIVTNKSSPFVHCYKLNDYEIQRVQSAKYLGLTISGNLSWSTHILGIIGRANSALSFFRRNFGQCTQTINVIRCISVLSVNTPQLSGHPIYRLTFIK